MKKWPSNIIIVRHGESEYNQEREAIHKKVKSDFSQKMKDTRNADIALSEKGVKQAQATGKLLKQEYKKFDAVFVSPFRRAQQTAENILDAWQKEIPVIVSEGRIREKEFGIFHAITKEEIQKQYPEWHHLKEIEGKYYFRPPGGESYPDIELRLHSFIGTLTRDYNEKNILLVSHSAIMLAFHKLMTRMNEEEVLTLDQENEIKNCGIISYKFDPKKGKSGKMLPIFFNKTAY